MESCDIDVDEDGPLLDEALSNLVTPFNMEYSDDDSSYQSPVFRTMEERIKSASTEIRKLIRFTSHVRAHMSEDEDEDTNESPTKDNLL